MHIHSILEDIGGAGRVTRARKNAFAHAPDTPVTGDPIGAVARTWHPGKLELVVTQRRPAATDATTIRFQSPHGGQLPPFYAGQYLTLELQIGDSLCTRPYSISSAPWEARQPDGFVEITVRRGGGFVSDYIYEQMRIGDRCRVCIGGGQFYYEPLRDADHIVALSGGVGITPFLSMAKEIAHGSLDIDLTILYGSEKEILCYAELEALQGERVHVIHVLSGDSADTPHWAGESGFLTAERIQAYTPRDANHAPLDCSYFICGPQVMYAFLQNELKKLQLPQRRVRFEVFGPIRDISSYRGYPAEACGQVFQMTVVRGIREDVIPARAEESIAVALERAGIAIDTGCRSGECGLCRTKVISGTYFVSPSSDGRRAADKQFGYVHACATFPTSDLRIKIPIL